MTPQEIFDKVCTHLMTQRVRASDGMRCRYRAINGRSCAVGCLIEDDVYHHQMEGLNVILLASQFGHILPRWFCQHVNLLKDLQIAHDRSLRSGVKNCAIALSEIAYNYKFTLPEIVERELA